MPIAKSKTLLLATSAQVLLLALAAPSLAHASEAPVAVTSLEASSVSADEAVETADSTVDALIVNGSRSPVTRQVTTGVLGERSALETPFSVTAVTAGEIKNLQVKDINGVFRNDASVTQWQSGQAQASGAQFRVRGLAIDQLNGYKIDGLAVPYWSIDFPIEHFEQIQLLKGATGFMYGFGGPGGIVNFVAKRPTSEFVLSGGIGLSSDNIVTTSVDVGGPLAGGRVGYRANVFYEEGDTYNGGFNRNKSASLALDFHLNDKLTLTLDGFAMDTLQRNQVNTIVTTAGVTRLDPVDGRTQLGATGAWKTNEMTVLTTTLNYQFNEDWKATASYRFSHLDENYPGNLIYIFNNAGDYSLAKFFVRRIFDYEQFQVSVNGKFETGPFTHEVVFGASRFTYDHYEDAHALAPVIGSGNIYSGTPPTLNGLASTYDPEAYKFNTVGQDSFFAADTIGWNRWSLLLGARWTHYTKDVWNAAGVLTARYDEKPITPTIALSYALNPTTRVYASYVEGLQSGGQAGVTNVNFPETFGPIKSEQQELGIKSELEAWTFTAALFRIEQDAGYVDPGNRYVQDGRIRYEGAEISATWRPVNDLSLAASYRHLDAFYLKTTASIIGKTVPGTPTEQATLSVSYNPSFVPGLSVYATTKYIGDGYGNTLNTQEYPSYTLVDVGVGYGFDVDDHPITVRAGIKNLGDHEYWTYGATTLAQGDPRTFSVSLDFTF